MRQKIPNSFYEKIHYDTEDIDISTISREDMLAIDRTSVDHFLAVDLGICEYRAADGRWVKKKLSRKSMGSTSLMIMEAARCEPGVYFGPKEIARLTKLNSMRVPNNLSARWRCLRVFHNEDFRNPNFFLSKRAGGMGVAWNPEKSFIQIVRIGVKE